MEKTDVESLSLTARLQLLDRHLSLPLRNRLYLQVLFSSSNHNSDDRLEVRQQQFAVPDRVNEQ